MADPNDAYDPDFSKNPDYVWDAATSSWKPKGNVGGPEVNGDQAAAARAANPFNSDSIAKGNKDPFKGGDLFAPDLYVAKGRDVNKGAFGPTAGMGALKGLMMKGATTDATGESLDVGAAERARGSQEGLLKQLLDMAAGKGPSPAQALMQQGADRNLADAAALTQSQRGLGATAASSQVAGQRAQIGQENSRDMGILRLQEQMQATQAAAGVAQGLRGQDVGQEQARAQIGLARDNLNASMRQKYIDMGMSAEEADRKAAMEMERLLTGQSLAITGMNQQEYQRGETQRRGDFGKMLDAVGGAGEFLMSLLGGAPAK